MRAVKQIESDIRTKIFERNRGGAYRLRKAFTLFDKDASGDIDIEEFNEALRWFGLQYADRASDRRCSGPTTMMLVGP